MQINGKNVAWKLLQAAVGLALISIQSHFLSGEELALLAISQAIIVVVVYFDIGFGVQLTTWLVNSLSENSRDRAFEKRLAIKLLSTRYVQLLCVALFQSVIFGVTFFILSDKILLRNNLYLSLCFALSVFLHSIGISLSKALIATAEIEILVRSQGLGSILGFLGAMIGLGMPQNLFISILSLGVPSLFVGLMSFPALRNASSFEREEIRSLIANIDAKMRFEWQPILQLTQVVQFLYPLLTQYLVVSLENHEIVAYLMCQKIFSAIGNALSTDTQLNYTKKHSKERFMQDVLLRFKMHYLAYIAVCILAIVILVSVWGIILTGIPRLTYLELLTFLPLGLFTFIDQASRIRLYVLKLFKLDFYSTFTQFSTLLLLSLIIDVDSLLVLNYLLIFSNCLKFLMLTSQWRRPFPQNM